MASISINHEDLCALIGRKLTIEELKEILPKVKCEIEGVEGKEIRIETTHERPDLISAAGIARAIRGYTGKEKGVPTFKIKRGNVVVIVDKSVLDIRPITRCSIVRGAKLTEEAILDIMQLQEKLHEIYCRKRETASIGVYDLDTITPPIVYGGVVPSDIRFIPLESEREMTGDEILMYHPKGRAYAHLLQGKPRYPVLADSKGKVLSMPPIVNSEDTKITKKTKNLFIDVSGLDENTVNQASSIIVTSLAERGGIIETITEVYPQGKKIVSPALEIKKITLNPSYAEKILGIQLKPEKIVDSLMKMRFTASAGPRGINVTVPPYRFDILHPIDIVEEIAIAHGLENFETRLPKSSTKGSLHPTEEKKNRIRDLMIGLGFQEILTYILSSEEMLTSKMNIQESEYARLGNPVSSEYSVMRNALLPKMMDFLSQNKHNPLPQKLFEISEVVEVAKEEPSRTRTVLKLCAAVEDSATGFTDIKSYFESLSKNLGLKHKLRRGEHPSLIPGRTAQISGGLRGVMGEVSPQTLTNFGLENPVSCFEIYVQ